MSVNTIISTPFQTIHYMKFKKTKIFVVKKKSHPILQCAQVLYYCFLVLFCFNLFMFIDYTI